MARIPFALRHERFLLGALVSSFFFLALGCIGADPQAGTTGSGGTGTGGTGVGAQGGGGASTATTTVGGGGSGGGCDSQNDPMNCGECGRKCSLFGGAMPSCSFGLCDSKCPMGVLNLTRPPAPVPDDGCERVGKRVFVTDQPVFAGFGVAMQNGAKGGDGLCQGAADMQMLGGQWKAWTSDFNSTPLQRFMPSSQPYFLLDGKMISPNFAGLIDGAIDAPINLSEKGQIFLLTEVWTGTDPSGNVLDTSGQCAGWTDIASDNFGTVGRTDSAGVGWTVTFDLQNCDRNNVHLYCFEQ